MARPGGYILSDEECYSFSHAECFESDFGGDLSFEATGEHCLLLLPEIMWQSRTGWVQDILNIPFPYEVPWSLPEQGRLDRLGFVEVPDLDPLTACTLWVPGRFLEMAKIQITLAEVDVPRSLVFANMRIIALTEAGDMHYEFELWLACHYRGELQEHEW